MMKSFYIGIAIVLGYAAVAHAAPLFPLPEKYQMGHQIHVLIVPGHDNEFSGSSANGMREADINLRLAAELADQLGKDPQMQVTLSRDSVTGQYTPELAAYFNDHIGTISNFIAEHKKAFAKKTRELARDEGQEEPKQVPHGNANQTVAFRLYATNAWANEKGFDFIIHVHFNDTYPRGGSGGEYGGYSIYVPGAILPNRDPADALASAIGSRIGDIVAKSNLNLESELANSVGVIDDTKLIALGAYGTLDVPSLLIEYSYIYEPQVTPVFWNVTLPAYARATVLGIYDYVRQTRSTESTFSYSWKSDLAPSTREKKSDVVALQMALRQGKWYPPVGKKTSDCPVSGLYGPCTKASVAVFQKQSGMVVDGLFGSNSRALFNQLFTAAGVSSL